MRLSPFASRLLLCGAILALSAMPGRALELVGGDINKTAPTSTDFLGGGTLPWSNVWTLNGASAVFLGDVGGNGTFWVLTAAHVAGSLPSTISDGTTTYNTVAGSYRQLHNADNSLTDLAIFALSISSLPSGLNTISLMSSTPITGDDIYYVGYGGGTKRWGFNDKELGTYSVNDGTTQNPRIITTFRTTYTTGSSNQSEAQAITGDSGGAAFLYNTTTGTWQLAGVILAVDTTSSPNLTYSANIATYRSEILASVPEPSALSLLLLGATALGWRRRRA